MQRLAILLTCHNRRDATLRCLAAVHAADPVAGLSIHVVLVDDGSTDGTGDEVGRRFPNVQIIRGDGTLFWAGGMRLALSEALREDYDFYLFLNDDTTMDRDAIARLMATYATCRVAGCDGTVVGTTRDPLTGRATYGGLRRASWWRPLKLDLVPPGEEPIECDTMNTNFALVPRSVVSHVGNLDATFTHRIADVDYGFRVRRAGFKNWVMPGTIGLCANDHRVEGTWCDSTLPLRTRLTNLMSPKGLNLHEWRVFTRRHAGPLWFVFWLSPYAKVFVSALISGRRNGSS